MSEQILFHDTPFTKTSNAWNDTNSIGIFMRLESGMPYESNWMQDQIIYLRKFGLWALGIGLWALGFGFWV